MSDQIQISSKSERQQKREIQDDEVSDSCRRKRTAKNQAKNEGKQVFSCKWCEKEYLSYPALYTHCKQKHPDQKISCKNETKQSTNPPIQKMKTLLKQSCDFQTEQMERKLIMIIHNCTLRIIEELQKLDPAFAKLFRRPNKHTQKIEDVKKAGREFATVNGFDKEFFQNEEVFRSLQGKFSNISFGSEILQVFLNSKIATKIYLHLVSLQNFESYSSELLAVQERIWSNSTVDWRFLFQSWRQFRQYINILKQQKQDSQ